MNMAPVKTSEKLFLPGFCFLIKFFLKIPEEEQVNIGIGFLPDFKRVVHIPDQQEEGSQQHTEDGKKDKPFVLGIEPDKE
jgi:hypothetical protein